MNSRLHRLEERLHDGIVQQVLTCRKRTFNVARHEAQNGALERVRHTGQLLDASHFVDAKRNLTSDTLGRPAPRQISSLHELSEKRLGIHYPALNHHPSFEDAFNRTPPYRMLLLVIDDIPQIFVERSGGIRATMLLNGDFILVWQRLAGFIRPHAEEKLLN